MKTEKALPNMISMAAAVRGEIKATTVFVHRLIGVCACAFALAAAKLIHSSLHERNIAAHLDCAALRRFFENHHAAGFPPVRFIAGGQARCEPDRFVTPAQAQQMALPDESRLRAALE
ncbi:MAG: hypothetical protein ACR2HJ_06210 [Fimbriimonadales bacterium]